MDVKVVNESGKPETDVYIKPTYSHQGFPMLKHYAGGGFVLRRLSLKGECGICVVFLVERGYEKNFIQQKWIERDKHPEMEH